MKDTIWLLVVYIAFIVDIPWVIETRSSVIFVWKEYVVIWLAVKQYVETNQNVLKWLMNNSLLREILSQLTHKWWVDSVGAWSGVGDRLGLWQWHSIHFYKIWALLFEYLLFLVSLGIEEFKFCWIKEILIFVSF